MIAILGIFIPGLVGFTADSHFGLSMSGWNLSPIMQRDVAQAHVDGCTWCGC